MFWVEFTSLVVQFDYLCPESRHCSKNQIHTFWMSYTHKWCLLQMSSFKYDLMYWALCQKYIKPLKVSCLYSKLNVLFNKMKGSGFFKVGKKWRGELDSDCDWYMSQRSIFAFQSRQHDGELGCRCPLFSTVSPLGPISGCMARWIPSWKQKGVQLCSK